MKLHWQPNYKLLIFSGFFLPVTIIAGLWQLQRAEEKQLLLDEQSARSQLPATSLLGLDENKAQNYRSVNVAGEWSSHYFLLENKVRNGRPGYEVIGQFLTDSGLLLVNRGWVESGYDRQTLPVVTVPTGRRTINGYLYRSKQAPFTLGEQSWAGSWPERLVALEWEAMEARLGHHPYPYILRLDASSSDALLTGWDVVSILPERHIGYSVQWFLMALALVVLTTFASSNLADVWRARKTKD